MSVKSDWKEISSGMYGVVYWVHDKDRDYAYKVSNFKEDGESIIRELQILSRVDHPNVLTLINFVAQPDFILILELAEGTLSKYIMNIDEISFIGYQLVRGLEYLHNQDIIHGDIKPANILYVHCDGEIKVMFADFGISTFGSCPYGNKIANTAFTLPYRAPELLLGYTYSFSADIWAVGCCLAEFYLKYLVFPGTTDQTQLMTIFSKIGIPDEKSWPGITSVFAWNDSFTKITLRLLWIHFIKEPQLTDLLKQMLVLHPRNRATAKQLLHHPYFNSSREKVETQIPCMRYDDITNYTCDELLEFRELASSEILVSQESRDILFSWLADIVISMKINTAALFLSYKFFDAVFIDQQQSTHKTIGCSCLYIADQLFGGKYHPAQYARQTGTILSELYTEIFTTLTKIGYELYQSTPYDMLHLMTKDSLNNINTFFLILLAIDKRLPKESNKILAQTAIFLTALFQDQLHPFIPEVEELVVKVFAGITQDRERNLSLTNLCQIYTGLDWSKVKNKINSWIFE